MKKYSYMKWLNPTFLVLMFAFNQPAQAFGHLLGLTDINSLFNICEYAFLILLAFRLSLSLYLIPVSEEGRDSLSKMCTVGLILIPCLFGLAVFILHGDNFIWLVEAHRGVLRMLKIPEMLFFFAKFGNFNLVLVGLSIWGIAGFKKNQYKFLKGWRFNAFKACCGLLCFLSIHAWAWSNELSRRNASASPISPEAPSRVIR